MGPWEVSNQVRTGLYTLKSFSRHILDFITPPMASTIIPSRISPRGRNSRPRSRSNQDRHFSRSRSPGRTPNRTTSLITRFPRSCSRDTFFVDNVKPLLDTTDSVNYLLDSHINAFAVIQTNQRDSAMFMEKEYKKFKER